MDGFTIGYWCCHRFKECSMAQALPYAGSGPRHFRLTKVQIHPKIPAVASSRLRMSGTSASNSALLVQSNTPLDISLATKQASSSSLQVLPSAPLSNKGSRAAAPSGPTGGHRGYRVVAIAWCPDRGKVMSQGANTLQRPFLANSIYCSDPISKMLKTAARLK